ncbi:hypothetical protein Gogos_001460 [Gossypium gossypioides]|uniref:Fiber protein Fb15 n=1 Tax=Gossypium gossypioides TaxID=34282 RepID=A0A7J9CW36_GOSGO|nr:hypothetical protein [Gossypium gossypioides]
MAMRKVYSEIKGMKLKEVPGYFKPMLSMGYLKKSVQRGLDNYHAKYIETDSIEPLYHVCFGGMIFSYLVALPNERRHLEHKKHAEQHEPSTGLYCPWAGFYLPALQREPECLKWWIEQSESALLKWTVLDSWLAAKEL